MPSGKLPLNLTLPPLGTSQSFELSLDAGETLSLESSGTGDLRIGYARLEGPPTLGAVAVFSGTKLPEEVLLYEAGVPATAPVQNFHLLVDSLGFRNTGVALVRERDDSGTGSLVEIRLELFDQGLQFVGDTVLQLRPGEKLAKFVDELFEDETVQAQAREMRGSLRISSQSRPKGAVSTSYSPIWETVRLQERLPFRPAM